MNIIPTYKSLKSHTNCISLMSSIHLRCNVKVRKYLASLAGMWLRLCGVLEPQAAATLETGSCISSHTEISHSGNIYTMEISKSWKSDFFFCLFISVFLELLTKHLSAYDLTFYPSNKRKDQIKSLFKISRIIVWRPIFSVLC